jgi:hypothetical protein
VKKVLLISSLIIVIFAGAAIPAVDWIAEASGINNNARQEMEAKILNSTVRIVVQTWVVQPGDSGYEIDHAVGHATVMDGRYLVTHNHFPIPLSIHPQEGDPESFGKVFIYNAQGQLLVEAPLSDFELVLEEEEILVFAYNGGGLFEGSGIESAEFKDWGSLTLEAGMEVAQIDWDGETTRVDWTTIQEMKLEDGAPRLVLEDGAIPGASGGGIFWNGFHVANNWRIEEQVDASGAVVDTVTTVALNTAQVAG